ncbi:hypothetical protein [Propionicicella superfundia]|uniref:hypothetical protein n=1 Tax=Propionicicella superfundia TaxID=348582 RepID=UPI000420FB45|nr:hypothetical protein [Propionicicella superfundia]
MANAQTTLGGRVDAAGLSINGLALASGISYSTLRRKLASSDGLAALTMRELLAIAGVLDVWTGSVEGI